MGFEAELGYVDGDVATNLTEQRLGLEESEKEEEVKDFRILFKHSNDMIIMNEIKIINFS